jgi:hypothetical protein
MAINYELINKGGISLSANFELLSEKPLDTRLVVPTFEGLQNLIDNAAVYEGLVVYVKDQKNHYKVQVAENGAISYRELNLTEAELKNLIASETAGSFNAAEEAVETETRDRITAINAEKASREAADSVLANAINQEKLRAEAEETRLENLITTTATAFKTDTEILDTNIKTETEARLSTDQVLQEKLNTEISRAEQKETELEQTINTSVITLNQTINDHCSAESLARITAVNQLTTDLETAKIDLETKLNTEVAVRRSADEALTQRLEEEQTTRENAIVDLQNELASEIENARAVEESLRNSLTQEVQLREATNLATNNLLSAEAATRESNDIALSESLATKAYELTAAINAEKAAREEAIVNTTADYIKKLAQEKSDRETADLVLTNAITTEEARATAEELRLETLITEGTAALQADYTILNQKIDTEVSDRVSATSILRTDLNAESARATQQENTLAQTLATSIRELTADINNRCDTETAVRELLISQTSTELNTKISELATQLNMESGIREEAISELQTSIQTEIAEREDAIVDIQEDLVQETTIARSAEDALNQKISREISDRSTSEAAIINIINSEIEDRVGAVATVQTEINFIVGRDDLTGDTVEIISIPQAIQTATNYCNEALKNYTTTELQQKIDDTLDKRIIKLEEIDHTKLAEDASAAAVATVLNGAPKKFDTLKEIAAWIAEENTAEDAASLVTRVSALEEVKDDYKGADAKLKEELEGKIEVIDNHSHNNKDELDKIADGDVAKWNSKTTITEVKAQIETYGYATINQVATAKQEAIGDAAGKYETIGTAQGIVDGLKLGETYEPIGAEDRAKDYTNGLVNPLAGRVKAIEDAPYATTGNVSEAISTFNTETIVPIVNILAGIGGAEEPKTVIEAITDLITKNALDDSNLVTKTLLETVLVDYATKKYVNDNAGSGSSDISFSIEDETLIIK